MRKSERILLILAVLSVCASLVLLALYFDVRQDLLETPVMTGGTYVDTKNKDLAARQTLAMPRDDSGEGEFCFYTQYPQTLEQGRYREERKRHWTLYLEDGTYWASVTAADPDLIQIFWPDGRYMELTQISTGGYMPGF